MNDHTEKKGQIAHLDRDPANNKLDNLAFLCLEHHDQYDVKPSQAKGLRPAEVKAYRADLLVWVSSGAGGADAQPPVVSYNQQGGITADTVNINETTEPKLHARELFINRHEGQFYNSKFELVVDSPYPPANLYLAVRAPSIVGMALIPQRSGMTTFGHSGKREGMAFTNLAQPYGTLHLNVRTTTADELKMEYDFT